ncbi:hypothetical protein ACWCO6_35330, partial [Streptomyces sp. NPDC001809]
MSDARRAHGPPPAGFLNPGTPLSAVEEVAHLVEQVVVMAVNPGTSD